MVEIACAPYPWFVASRLEARRENSYTVDTLERFRTGPAGARRTVFPDWGGCL